MAWFDVGAGLAEMGQAVAKTASLALLEQQKSDLDKERLTLANELATERESRGRKEAHGYDMEKLDKTQTHQADQNEKDRQNRITTTGMSVGGQLASTRMSIDARREEAAEDRKLRQQEMNDRFILGRETNQRHAEDAASLAEYRRNSLAAQLAGHGTVRVNEEDRTAVLVNTATGETKPLMDVNGKPLKITDPEAGKALNTAIQDESKELTELNKWFHETLTPLNADRKNPVIALDPNRAKEIQAQIDKVNETYEAKKNLIQQRKNAFLDRLLGRVGMDAPGAVTGSPTPLNQIITGKPRTVVPGEAY